MKVELNNASEPETAAPAKSVGTVRLFEDPAESDECNRTLILTTDPGTNVTVTARQTEDGKAPLCEIADVAAAGAMGVLNKGPIARRSPPFPARSLAHRNACALLGADALDIVPGIDAGDPDVGFGGWDCEWHSTTRDLDIELRFDRDQPLTAADGNPTRLRGYRTFIEAEGDGEETCLVRTVVREYVDQKGRTAIEMLYLVVSGEQPADRLCSMGTRLADSAAAALP
ncbi:hypothetical protein GCM10010191_09020 [Actinomadura vinacea]|uniref:Uncharacterized protein n=1 Tax=Actinomadura vinacea TaxID=115336 RepID=A0ABP5VHU6_9ACTN